MTAQTVADFMSAAPASVNGSSPWASRYAVELKRVIHEHAARAPRTLQSHLGPSELGVECDRQVAGKMAALPSTNHVADPWPSIMGTAGHGWLEGAFQGDNTRSGRMRWLTEQRVTPHPDHPGTADLYDGDEQAVVDHKLLGKTSLDKVRRGWPRHYEVQLKLYGLGYFLMGLPVRRVVLAAYPRTAATLDGLFVREAPFAAPIDPSVPGSPLQILPEVVELLAGVFEDTARRKAQAEQLLTGALRFEQIPASPSDDGCYFCSFYRPQSARDGGPGCPGTVSPS